MVSLEQQSNDTWFIGQLSETVVHAETLEDLVRPLLELLGTATGLESTYLTSIDAAKSRQSVVFARNAKRLRIKEGLSVPWEDTLCLRALKQSHPYADDVAERWGDSVAARKLGISTFASMPVVTRDGQLYGTLCAAGSDRTPQAPASKPLLELFSRIIAQQIDREHMLQSLRKMNEALKLSANTDPTTRLPNRRSLMEEMDRRFHGGQYRDAMVVAFIDLDGFKVINDTYGHEAGDRFLQAIGKRLRSALREGDYVARIGGDEFVVLSAAEPAATEDFLSALPERLLDATSGHFSLGAAEIDYSGPSIGVAVAASGDATFDAVLARADAAMYETKRARKASSTHLH